jgi:hypothetical protein
VTSINIIICTRPTPGRTHLGIPSSRPLLLHMGRIPIHITSHLPLLDLMVSTLPNSQVGTLLTQDKVTLLPHRTNNNNPTGIHPLISKISTQAEVKIIGAGAIFTTIAAGITITIIAEVAIKETITREVEEVIIHVVGTTIIEGGEVKITLIIEGRHNNKITTPEVLLSNNISNLQIIKGIFTKNPKGSISNRRGINNSSLITITSNSNKISTIDPHKGSLLRKR